MSLVFVAFAALIFVFAFTAGVHFGAGVSQGVMSALERESWTSFDEVWAAVGRKHPSYARAWGMRRMLVLILAGYKAAGWVEIDRQGSGRPRYRVAPDCNVAFWSLGMRVTR